MPQNKCGVFERDSLQHNISTLFLMTKINIKDLFKGN
jgi:hypothetical protein